MTPDKAHRTPYEQPCSEVFEITTHGVLCQSGPDMEAHNLENPMVSTSSDNSW